MRFGKVFDTKKSSGKMVTRLRTWNRARLDNRKAAKPAAKGPETLCVLGIFKNEELGIDEWIEHYLWQGADKIILIDNASTDGSFEKIQSWRGDARIEYIRLDEPFSQRQHYWTAIEHFKVRENWTWLVIADLDEFWFSKDGQPLCQKLGDYEDADVVYCNWSLFGCPSDAPHPPSLRAALVHKHPQLQPHKHKKYMVRAECLTKASMIEIHSIRGLDSGRTISDNVALQVNHYYTQSRHFWTQVKMPRGSAFDPLTSATRVLAVFDDVNAKSVEEDTLLAELVAGQNARGVVA